MCVFKEWKQIFTSINNQVSHKSIVPLSKLVIKHHIMHSFSPCLCYPWDYLIVKTNYSQNLQNQLEVRQQQREEKTRKKR